MSGEHDSKDFTLLGYDMHRHDCLLQTTETSAYGMAVYSKVQHQDQVIHTHTDIIPAVVVIEYATINLPSWDLCVIGVYASPKVVQKKVNTYLMERMASCRGRQVIVLGEFNVDLKKKEVPFQALKDMKQHIQAPTTDYMSILDHIYTNIVDIQTGVFESYFSDHKPVWIKLKRPN